MTQRTGSGIEESVKEGNYCTGSAGIMYRSSENETVGVFCSLSKFVYNVVLNAFPVAGTISAGKTAGNSSGSEPYERGFDSIVIKCGFNFAKGNISGTVFMGTSVNKQYFHIF